MAKIDLHMHSLYSDDGEFTVKELVSQCKEAGIDIFAICDHNSAKANGEAKKLVVNDMKYITGIEIDCDFEELSLHVLGLGIDETDARYLDIEKNVFEQELNSSRIKIDLTNQLGFELTYEQMAEASHDGVFTGELFAEVLLEDKRYFDSEVLRPYRKDGSRGDNPPVNFYWDYYAQGKPCYTEIKYPSLEEVINLIHQTGGIAVLAHPGNNLNGQFELLDKMKSLGLDGVEAFSSYHTVEENEYFYNKAKELDMIFTCGSDYHGKTKPAIKLGEMGTSIKEEALNSMEQWLRDLIK